MHACTQLFKEEFAGIPSALNNCASKPLAMTTKKAVKAGKAVLNQTTEARRKAEKEIQVHELTCLTFCVCV